MAAKKLDFESAMTRLEEIVRKLEQGDATLTESVALFEEGTKLSASIHKLLAEAEQKVTVIRQKADGTTHEEPFVQEELK